MSKGGCRKIAALHLILKEGITFARVIHPGEQVAVLVALPGRMRCHKAIIKGFINKAYSLDSVESIGCRKNAGNLSVFIRRVYISTSS